MLREFLPYLAPLKEVILTCLKDNEYSKKIILKNGGIYINTVYEKEENQYYERYNIKLQ